jgi:hypothetical protein
MIENLYKQISDLPPLSAPPPHMPDPRQGAPPGQVRCACGKKFIQMTDIAYHKTGLVDAASDTECKECLPAHKGFALVVCLTCKAVVAKMPPKKYQGGFEMLASRCYHVTKCPTCHPDIKTSHVLEKYLYDKERGYPVPEARDVLAIG